MSLLFKLIDWVKQNESISHSVVSNSATLWTVTYQAPVHGILQARILEWITTPFSKGSSWPRDQTQVSHIAVRFFSVWTKLPFQIWVGHVQVVEGLNRTTTKSGQLTLHKIRISPDWFSLNWEIGFGVSWSSNSK